MTIETTSVPDAIDYLLATIRALDLCDSKLDPIPVYDGLPDQPDNPPDQFVSVGGAIETVVSAVDQWASLGGPNGIPARDESYRISAYVSCYVGGSGGSTSGPSDTQKTARDQAFTIYRAIEQALRAVPQLGTIITTGWSSFADTSTVTQTAYGDPNSGMGRACTIEFDVAVYRRKRTF